MSGSFDKRTNPYGETQPGSRNDPRLELGYDDVRTGAPTTAPPPTQSQRAEPPRAPAMPPATRSHGKHPSQMKGAIVPPSSVTGKSLTLVITIMCFLACLTAGAVYLINQSATAWLQDIASEVTVQIEPVDTVAIDKQVVEVTEFLKRQPGIQNAKPLSLETSTDLLEPWLGKSEALKALPVPRLIAIDINRNQPPNFSQLRQSLTTKFKNVILDDHRQWKRQIQTVTRSFALGGLAILLLVAAATTAIIVSATRSSMASNREIVEVLHFVGATDRFIAHEFEKHFLTLGIRAGLVGAGFAVLVFLLMPLIMQLLGGGAVTLAELHRFVGDGSLDAGGYVFLGAVVFVIAALCMLTSRYGVYRILHSQQ